MYETSTQISTTIPARLWSEVTEAVLLVLLTTSYIFVAIVLAYRLWKQRRIKPPAIYNGQPGPFNSFWLFKSSLYCSDCMIMLIYASVKAIWLLEFQWRFGTAGCKAYRFFSSLAFLSNSNVVCAIALDRYLSVYSNHIIGARQYQRTKRMLCAVWGFALITALPQLFVWEAYRPSPHNWKQCVTVFAIKLHQLPLDSPRRDQVKLYSMLYEAYHQAMTFWVPLSITISSYVRMMSRLIPFWPFSVLHSYEDERQKTLCTIFWSKIRDKMNSLFCIALFRRKSYASQQSARVPLAGTTRHPPTTALRRQLGTTVFKNACTIALAHVVLWLPYNIISLSRFVDEEFYEIVSQNGGNLCEILILLNCFVNPIVYSGGLNNGNRV